VTGSDEGAAASVALALVGALVTCALALGIVADLLGARQRAADVADLAALAAVSAVLPDSATACADADWVARQHGATLESCSVVDGDARVVVSLTPRGPASAFVARVLGSPPVLSAGARAGRR
jgi:secretion/DNA translocation related TadE-like protein